MTDITSASNPKCKYARSLMQKKERVKNGEYTVEGAKSVRDAIRSGKNISAIYLSRGFYDNTDFDYPENVSLYRVPDGVFERLSDTKAPQGILAVLSMEEEIIIPELQKAYIYCDGINDPGNLGTIIRTADAAGFGGVFLSEGCADLYNPKTVRASMGSYFNMRVMRNVSAGKLLEYKTAGFELLGGALEDDSIDYRNADMKKPVIIIVGNEANGISKEVLDICRHVKIPILGKAESLNAAVAAAILMYELVEQRS